jgi:hypothetical protein
VRRGQPVQATGSNTFERAKWIATLLRKPYVHHTAQEPSAAVSSASNVEKRCVTFASLRLGGSTFVSWPRQQRSLLAEKNAVENN